MSLRWHEETKCETTDDSYTREEYRLRKFEKQFIVRARRYASRLGGLHAWIAADACVGVRAYPRRSDLLMGRNRTVIAPNFPPLSTRGPRQCLEKGRGYPSKRGGRGARIASFDRKRMRATKLLISKCHLAAGGSGGSVPPSASVFMFWSACVNRARRASLSAARAVSSGSIELSKNKV